jgi:TonB-linked SusC/RagA family outer membrane protein
MKKQTAAIFIAFIFSFAAGISGLYAQENKEKPEVTGRVTDAKDGSGLPGVNVILKGTTSGTITDIEGKYRIRAEEGAKLEFRFIGYTTENRIVKGPVLDVALIEEGRTLKEAVVVGYGSLSKKDVTGAIGTVTSKDFQAGQITSPEQLIQGKVAGVQITSGGGAPGGGSQIRIRGGASLFASNDPLYVIDGVPVDNGGIAGSPNPLSLINPSDIETFTVLKDASATAIYGSRASNGVIIITTKKGTAGMKPMINFSSQYSIGVIAQKAEVLSADSIRAIVNRRGSEAQKKLLGKASTDWQDQIFQAAATVDHNLNFTGAWKNMPYRISAGWLSQEGILKTDLMQRQTLGVNLNPTFLDGNLKIGFSFKGSRSANNFANGGAIGSAIGFDPTQPVFNVDSNGVRSDRFGGYFEWRAGNGLDQLSGRNPVSLLYGRSNQSEVFRGIGNVTIDYNLPFVKGLRANLNVGVDAARGSGKVIVNDSTASDWVVKGNRSQYLQEKMNNLLEFYLSYDKELPSLKSRFNLMAGTAFQDFWSKNYSFQRNTFRPFISEGILVDTLPGDKPPVFPYDIPQNRLASFYGRLNYSFMEKINFTFSLRQDGSSRFAPKTRWGLFPSAALSYRLSEEPFMKKLPGLSLVKLRAGWGETGQQDIGSNYSYQSFFNISSLTAQYQFGDRFFQMARPSAYEPNIRWESTVTYNAGLDLGFLDDRITASVDLYLKKTNDLLNLISTPAGANFGTNVITNVGNVENRGIEIQVNTIPVKTRDFQWELGFNITSNANKITKLTAVRDSLDPGTRVGGISGGTGNTIQIFSVGYPVNSFYVFKQVYENGRPVEGVFEDLNGDGLVNQSDLYRYKQPSPTVFYGISTQMSYRNAFLGFVIRGATGNYLYNNVASNSGTYQSILAQTTNLSNASADVIESGFTGVGKNADYRLLSDYYVRDASFIRMDNINFGYDFGKVYNDKIALKLTGTIQNVFLITPYKGLDPEIPGGIDNTIYPRPRTFVLGLNLSFM